MDRENNRLIGKIAESGRQLVGLFGVIGKVTIILSGIVGYDNSNQEPEDPPFRAPSIAEGVMHGPYPDDGTFYSQVIGVEEAVNSAYREGRIGDIAHEALAWGIIDMDNDAFNRTRDEADRLEEIESAHEQALVEAVFVDLERAEEAQEEALDDEAWKRRIAEQESEEEAERQRSLTGDESEDTGFYEEARCGVTREEDIALSYNGLYGAESPVDDYDWREDDEDNEDPLAGDVDRWVHPYEARTYEERNRDERFTPEPWGDELDDYAEYHQRLLAQFEADSENDAIWETVYSLVRGDGDETTLDNAESYVLTISAQDLIYFAERVRNTDPAKRYELTAEQAPNGKLWFDVLSTFSSDQIERAKLTILQDICEESGSTFNQALDVGTATGKSLTTLEQVAQHVTGLDQNDELLAVASNRMLKLSTLVKGDADDLPFDNNSFDLISSSGLEGALDKATTIRFYEEISRTLTVGGIYIAGSCYTNDQGYRGKELDDITRSSKAMLADMIVDTISGKLAITDRLGEEERQELLANLGLSEVNYVVEDTEYGDGTVSLIRVLTKI